MSEPLLAGRGLVVRYGNQVAVDHVDLAIAPRERVGLVGESASGKSTLLRLLLRLIDVDAGEVSWEGRDITRARGRALLPFRRAAQLVFQDPGSALHPRFDVETLIAEGLIIHGLYEARRAERVGELLAEVGLDDSLRRRRPHELSGGQKQRVCLARALAVEPSVVLLDEPLSSLDVSIQAQIVNLFSRLGDEHHLAWLLVSHDLAVVGHLCERVVVMFRGRIVEEGPVALVLQRPSHPYTQALVAAAPTGALAHRRSALPVLVEPEAADVSRGCSFQSRCPEVTDRCKDEQPRLRAFEQAHRVACHVR
jgi:oligopeptide/dipeptide ABC transporter ATP-binding protein